MSIELVAQMIDGPRLVIVFILVVILSLGVPKSNQLSLARAQNQNTEAFLLLVLN
jgi:hypothetical protein